MAKLDLKTALEEWLQQLSPCTCGRLVIEAGRSRTLEAAWDKNGHHEVINWFSRLVRGIWQNEQDWIRRLGQNRRLEVLSDLLMRFEDYCKTGTLKIPRELNMLDEAAGLKEIKVPSARVSFYESHTEARTSRCTHGFYKKTERTPMREIDKGLAIMRADMSR